AISLPADLNGSCTELHKLKNWPFAKRFLRHLKRKLNNKRNNHPRQLSPEAFRSIRSLKDFDTIYTAKAHGFKDALEYYAKCSCRQFLPNIKIPTLIINAMNDSFLSPEC